MMKRIIAILLSAAFAVSLAACSAQQPAEESSASSAVIETKAEQPTTAQSVSAELIGTWNCIESADPALVHTYITFIDGSKGISNDQGKELKFTYEVEGELLRRSYEGFEAPVVDRITFEDGNLKLTNSEDFELYSVYTVVPQF